MGIMVRKITESEDWVQRCVGHWGGQSQDIFAEIGGVAKGEDGGGRMQNWWGIYAGEGWRQGEACEKWV